jgi:hypothetical protein
MIKAEFSQRQLFFSDKEEQYENQTGIVCKKLFLEEDRYFIILWTNYKYETFIADTNNSICFPLDSFLIRPTHWVFKNSERPYAYCSGNTSLKSGLIVASYQIFQNNSDIWVALHEIGHLWLRENKINVIPGSQEDELLADKRACEFAKFLKDRNIINPFNYIINSDKQFKKIIEDYLNNSSNT